MQEILITGSAGLIGSALQVALMAAGFTVREFDHIYAPNYHGYGDVCHVDALTNALSHCAGVIHLAALSRVVWGECAPQLCHDVNVGGTHAVLEAAMGSGHRPWVVLGSSREVYGNQAILPVPETAALSPVNTYAKSKYEAEEHVRAYAKRGLNAMVVRFSNVYGGIQDHADRVIPAFCRAAALGQPLRLDGPGHVFDFTYVTDVAEGLVMLVKKLMAGELELPTLHFVSGVGKSLLEVAQLARSAGGGRSNFVQGPAHSYSVSEFRGDTRLAQDVLGWRAHTTIESGVEQFVRAFKQLYQG